MCNQRKFTKLQWFIHLLMFGFLVYVTYNGLVNHRLISKIEAMQTYNPSKVQELFFTKVGGQYTAYMHNDLVNLSCNAQRASEANKFVLLTSLKEKERLGYVAIFLALLQLIAVVFSPKTQLSQKDGTANGR